MKCTIPEIAWHNRDPVLSVDIQPVCNEEFYRLASGGTDCHVLIWYLKIRKNGAVDVDVVSDLNRHQRAVNVVRWSPSGQYLATGDDDAHIIIWNLKTDNIPLLEGETSDKETWLVNKILRGHNEDVYDISWSPNGMKLISGSIDNTAILWDFSKGLSEYTLSDHKGFVQGVAWDPKGQYIATLSSDRVCRVFDSTGRNVKSRIFKGLLPVPESHALFNKEVKYFHDDTFKSYFRRLCFSPDGNLLITPSGCIEDEGYKAARHTTLTFTLDCLTQPAAMLPSPKQETIAVRCCPILFELHSDGISPVITLPYRIVIAVATDSDVVLYDTQQLAPFAHLQKIHYTRITDLAWSSDGLLLIASSTDGYCTLVTFEPEELGVQYIKEDSEAEENLLDISGCEELDKTEAANKNTEKEQIEIKPKKPNLLEQWAIRKPKTDILTEENAENKSKGGGNVLQEKPSVADPEPMDIDKNGIEVQKQVPIKTIPKRIAPIKIGETEKNKKPEKSVNSQKEKSNGPNTKKENVVDKTIKQETSCSNNDIIIIDDSSFKENKPRLSTPNRDCESKRLAKKEKHSDATSSRKRKIENKISTPNKKSSLLLKFLQSTKSKKESNIENKKISNTVESINSKVIEISDDECSNNSVTLEHEKTSSIRKTVDQNTVVKDQDNKIHKIEDNKVCITEIIIEIDHSTSSTSLNSLYNSTDPSSVSKKTTEASEIHGENFGKMYEPRKYPLDETESMKANEIVCIDDISGYKNIEKESTGTTKINITPSKNTDKTLKSEMKMGKPHFEEENGESSKANASFKSVLSDKENMEVVNKISTDDSDLNKDTKSFEIKTKVNRLHSPAENTAVDESQENAAETQAGSEENMETEEIPSAVSKLSQDCEKSSSVEPCNYQNSKSAVKAATPKTPRRIALVTLSSPKRKKNL